MAGEAARRGARIGLAAIVAAATLAGPHLRLGHDRGGERLPRAELDHLVVRRQTALRAAALCAALALVGCAPAPAPGTPAAPTSTLRATAGEPSGSAPPAADPLVDLARWPFPTGCVDTQATTPLLDAKSEGQRLLWSRGGNGAAPETAPDVFADAPGGPVATVYANPNRDSDIDNIVGWDGRVAFVEQNDRVYGTGGWRLWLTPSDGAAPVEVDTSEPSVESPLPFPAMRGDDLVWTAVHRVGGALRYQLLDYSVATGRTRAIASSDPTRTEYWFPSLGPGAALAYATVEHVAGKTLFAVYTGSLGGPATRLDTPGMATMPVLGGAGLAWIQLTLPNVYNGGLLMVERPGGEPPAIALADQPGVDYPSAGSRYATAGWGDGKVLEIVDLATTQTVTVRRWPESYPWDIVRPDVSGNLMSFIVGPEDPASTAPLRLCWARLPG